jgi:hypothetical protein
MYPKNMGHQKYLMQMKPRYILILLCILSIYLSLKRLDNTTFWGDEAHDAIFARNYLKFGQLTGWDGRNLYTLSNGNVMDQDLRTRNSPLDILVCAASFKLFGESTWAGRFPFVIAGVFSLWIFFLIVKTDFGEDEWVWLFTVGGLALSTVFILNIRSCRYYSLSLLTTLLIYYGYRCYLLTKKLYCYLLVTIVSILSFYANPMICAATLISIGILHLVSYRKSFSFQDWKISAGLAVLFLLLTVPYAIHHQIWYRPDHDLDTTQPWWVHRLLLVSWNLSAVNWMNSTPWPILIGLAMYLIKYKQLPIVRTTLQWALLGISHIICIALFSPQQTNNVSSADIRYLIVVIPFLMGMTGVFLWFVSRWSKMVGILLFLVFITSNVLTLTPSYKVFTWLLPGMIYEVHHDYPTATKAVADYLGQHAKQNDMVSCYPDFQSYPLMFYLGYKIKLCCSLDTESPFYYRLPKEIDAPVYKDEYYPDWIVCFGLDQNAVDHIKYFVRLHEENGKMVAYQYILDTVLPCYYFDTHRPEIHIHTFGPKRNPDNKNTFIFVYKKITPNNKIP